MKTVHCSCGAFITATPRELTLAVIEHGLDDPRHPIFRDIVITDLDVVFARVILDGYAA